MVLLDALSDLMAGLLFVFIVIVLVFAYKLNKATEAREDAVKEFRSTQAIRRNMLETIRENLEKHGITDIEINPETGVLSLREGILFPSGSTDLSIGGKEALSILALVLNDVLPCYAGSYDSVRLPGCADGLANGSLEAVFVEGHTDSIPVSGANRYRDNWNLSTARAIAVFSEMTLRRDLDRLEQAGQQQIADDLHDHQQGGNGRLFPVRLEKNPQVPYYVHNALMLTLPAGKVVDKAGAYSPFARTRLSRILIRKSRNRLTSSGLNPCSASPARVWLICAMSAWIDRAAAAR